MLYAATIWNSATKYATLANAMNEKSHQTVVMSVGGSLIVPDAIDTDFLQKLHTLITEETTATGRRFIIIAGGGKVARRYQEAAAEVSRLKNEDLDWLGIHATRLNGHLLRTIFRDIAYPTMITNPDEVLDVPVDTKLVVASGYRPGSSTDLRAVQIAERVHASCVINLSNTDYVYTANPKTSPEAEKIEDISWPDFRALLPEEWDPGLSAPFDPIAAKAAEANNTEVAQINGHRLDSLHNYLQGEPFIGTRIHN